jgi:hypothetical protein
LRQRVSARLLQKLHKYLRQVQQQVLPKSPSGAAVRYALNQWEALTRFLEDGELEIDNGATERANRDIASGEFIVHLIFKCLKTWTSASRNSADTDDLFVRSP